MGGNAGRLVSAAGPVVFLALFGTYLCAILPQSMFLEQQFPSLTISAAGPPDPAIRFSVSPSRLSLFAGEAALLRVKVSNSGPAVTMQLSMAVTSFPPGGSASDIVLAFPTSLLVPRGATMTTVTLTVLQGAFPGAYVMISTLSGG